MDQTEWAQYQSIIPVGTIVRQASYSARCAPSNWAFNEGEQGVLIANDVDGREDLLEELPVVAFNNPTIEHISCHLFCMDYWIDGKWLTGNQLLTMLTKDSFDTWKRERFGKTDQL
jgi:hypothetical protein